LAQRGEPGIGFSDGVAQMPAGGTRLDPYADQRHCAATALEIAGDSGGVSHHLSRAATARQIVVTGVEHHRLRTQRDDQAFECVQALIDAGPPEATIDHAQQGEVVSQAVPQPPRGWRSRRRRGRHEGQASAEQGSRRRGPEPGNIRAGLDKQRDRLPWGWALSWHASREGSLGQDQGPVRG